LPRDKKIKRPFRLSVMNRSLSFSPLGTRFIIVCVLVGMAAINTGANLLYLCVAMMLSMVVVSGVISEHTLRKLLVRRRLPDEIYAGEPFMARYQVENRKKRMPSFAVSVSSYGAGADGAAGFLLNLQPGGIGGASAHETVAVRGFWTIEGLELSTRFPFGLFKKSLRMPGREERLVYPPIVKLPIGLPDSLTRGYGETPSGVSGQGAEIRGLRDYQGYDEARLIHWKSSARLSKLLVRELEAEHKRTVTVLLDDLPPAGDEEGYDERFEKAVAYAAAAVRELLMEHDLPVEFCSRGFKVRAGAGPGHYREIMEGLALIKPTVAGEPGAAEQDTERKTALLISGGPCILVLPSKRSAWRAYSPQAVLVVEAWS
jgi:uncharacterized protein (DUF58 family)